jgi:hypothetical protein
MYAPGDKINLLYRADNPEKEAMIVWGNLNQKLATCVINTIDFLAAHFWQKRNNSERVLGAAVDHETT